MHRWNEEKECVEYVELTAGEKQRRDTAAAESTWVRQSLDWLEADQHPVTPEAVRSGSRVLIESSTLAS